MDGTNATNAALLYRKVENEIRRQIETGVLKPGDRIPSEAKLGEQFGVSRVTVRNAISNLVKEGILVRLQGKGTYVLSKPEENVMRPIYSFTTLCQLQGHMASALILDIGLQKAEDEDAGFLGLPPGSDVFVLSRLRLVDQVPVVIETCAFSPAFVFLEKDREQLEGSLYALLSEKYHIQAAKAIRSISICRTSESESQWLRVPVNTPLILSKSFVYDWNSQPLHTVRQVVRVDLPDIFQYYV